VVVPFREKCLPNVCKLPASRGTVEFVGQALYSPTAS
jgi:hypothetical protein